MSFNDIVLSSGARTPFGDFGKSLRDVPLTTLGVHAVQACLTRAGLSAEHVDHLVFGNTAPVDHDGLFACRKVALDAGCLSTARPWPQASWRGRSRPSRWPSARAASACSSTTSSRVQRSRATSCCR